MLQQSVDTVYECLQDSTTLDFPHVRGVHRYRGACYCLKPLAGLSQCRFEDVFLWLYCNSFNVIAGMSIARSTLRLQSITQLTQSICTMRRYGLHAQRDRVITR